MKKNEIIQVRIEDQSNEGLGIGKVSGLPFFIKDVVIGDEIEASITKMKKNYGFARVQKILRESPDRVQPLCPNAKPCGGCQIQSMSYPAQLRFKERKVENNLRRIGGFSMIPMETILGMEMPWHYRNKEQYPVGYDKEGQICVGFYAGRTHTIVPCTDCMLGSEKNQHILSVLLDFFRKYRISAYQEENGKGLLRHIMIRHGFGSGEIMVCLIVNGRFLPQEQELVEKLSQIKGMASILLNENTEDTNVILGNRQRLLWGKESIEDNIRGIRFSISSRSFYQVNPGQTERLYAKALEYAGLTGKETVWDLYCGIGTISLFLAQKARQVYGVEIIPEAIENARENARTNQIRNAAFFVGKAEEILPEKYEKEGIHADVIVIDPPRKGCEPIVLRTMLKMAPERIVYVSCDSATLARDLRILCDGGYELQKVCPVDMFGHTVHVETVCSLHRIEEKNM